MHDDDKRRLNVLTGTTCFAEHEKNNVQCKRQSCREWIDSPYNLNCSVIAAADGSRSLQRIGDVYGVSRMRIFQIQKEILRKVRATLEQDNVSVHEL